MNEPTTIPAITINRPDCPDPCAPNLIPAIRVQNDCCADGDGDGDGGSTEINEDYFWIGYYHLLTTVTYDLTGVTFPNTFWIFIDNNHELGVSATSVADLVVELNKLLLGTFTSVGNVITAAGYHNYDFLIPVE